MQALLASYEKNTPLLRLATLLEKNGWTLLGSSGTAKYLNENGISCRDVAEIVGKPILGHRVVTLSRELHAGLLAKPEDGDELKSLGIEPIDLVYVTLYPLEKTAADPSATPEDVIEKTDIGGPTLLRSAANASRRHRALAFGRRERRRAKTARGKIRRYRRTPRRRVCERISNILGT